MGLQGQYGKRFVRGSARAKIREMPSVSILVVSYRTPRLTVAAVRSALLVGDDADVVVVDNASGDDTVERLRRLGDPRLTIIENGQNEGFGAAANRAAQATEAQTLLFLNSDATLTKDAIAQLLAECSRWDGRAIVGPRLVEPEGGIQRSAGMLPKPVDLAVRATGLYRVGRWFGKLPLVGARVGRSQLVREYDSALVATEVISTNMVSGACFATGRKAFEELGGFDERFFMYFEDADLCRRAAAAGIPIRYVPGAVVTHVGGASSPGDYRFDVLHARSMRQYLGKWYGVGGSAMAIAMLWLRAAGFSLALSHRAGAAWRALSAAVRDEARPERIEAVGPGAPEAGPSRNRRAGP